MTFKFNQVPVRSPFHEQKHDVKQRRVYFDDGLEFSGREVLEGNEREPEIFFAKEQIIVLCREGMENETSLLRHLPFDGSQERAEFIVVQVFKNVETNRDINRREIVIPVRNIIADKLCGHTLFFAQLSGQFQSFGIKIDAIGAIAQFSKFNRKGA